MTRFLWRKSVPTDIGSGKGIEIIVPETGINLVEILVVPSCVRNVHTHWNYVARFWNKSSLRQWQIQAGGIRQCKVLVVLSQSRTFTPNHSFTWKYAWFKLLFFNVAVLVVVRWSGTWPNIIRRSTNDTFDAPSYNKNQTLRLGQKNMHRQSSHERWAYHYHYVCDITVGCERERQDILRKSHTN